jgi:hypothetical protein
MLTKAGLLKIEDDQVRIGTSMIRHHQGTQKVKERWSYHQQAVT